MVPGCLSGLTEASVLELSIYQFPFVIPSPNAIENTCGLLCGGVGLIDIPRFAEVDMALQ